MRGVWALKEVIRRSLDSHDGGRRPTDAARLRVSKNRPAAVAELVTKIDASRKGA
jgi:hypothetical protein